MLIEDQIQEVQVYQHLEVLARDTDLQAHVAHSIVNLASYLKTNMRRSTILQKIRIRMRTQLMCNN